MQPPPGFTQTLPADCDGNYRDWYFVWHPPANPVLTSDPALRRGTGMPEPAAKLGRYARLNTENQGYPEGWDWHWMPMAAFARMISQGAAQGDTAALQAKVTALEAELKALRGGLMIVHGEVSRLVGEVGS